METLVDSVEYIYGLDVSKDVIDQLCANEDAALALDNLDIQRADRKCLSDILDPDNGGTIKIIEFVDGLRRLRGEPRRSDIITLDLMLRSIQIDIQDLMLLHSEIENINDIRTSCKMDVVRRSRRKSDDRRCRD